MSETAQGGIVVICGLIVLFMEFKMGNLGEIKSTAFYRESTKKWL